jgi:hypothetical protein
MRVYPSRNEAWATITASGKDEWGEVKMGPTLDTIVDHLYSPIPTGWATYLCTRPAPGIWSVWATVRRQQDGSLRQSIGWSPLPPVAMQMLEQRYRDIGASSWHLPVVS